MKKLLLVITTMLMILAFSITVYANSSPTADFSTDSSDILVADADTSVPDVKKLLDGSLPKDVLGDESLEGYSTLGIFSVIAVDGYDFSNETVTDIKMAGLTSDMTVEVRMLDSSNEWSDISHTISDGMVSAVFKEEGQVAVFVLESVDMSDVDEDEDTTEETTTEDLTEEDTEQTVTDDGNGNNKRSPKTGDIIYLFVAVALFSSAGIAVALKKLR
ncbi:MAG: hypothetical protein ACI4EF_08445 [Coprococcus sp.]